MYLGFQAERHCVAGDPHQGIGHCGRPSAIQTMAWIHQPLNSSTRAEMV